MVKEIPKKMYALICKEAGICGIFNTKKDAIEFNKDIKRCPAKHKIKKVMVEIMII